MSTTISLWAYHYAPTAIDTCLPQSAYNYHYKHMAILVSQLLTSTMCTSPFLMPATATQYTQ